MAIKLEDLYLNVNAADSNYPGGSFKNASSPTATDGTPFEEQWANDVQGLLQGLLAITGIVPSGVPDTVLVSQYLQALLQITGATAASVRTILVNDTVEESDRIIVIDATGGNVELTFLSAASSGAKALRVQRARSDPGTYTVTLTPAGVETLGGESSITLLPGESYLFHPDGTSDFLQF